MAESDLPMPYQYYLSLDRASSLKLGIEGSDEAANNERLRLATRLLEEYNRIDNDAYATSRSMIEPDTPKPFGLELLVEHQGDVEAVLRDGAIREAVRDHLGHRPGHQFIDDEDGQRWVWFDGGRRSPYIQTEIDVTLTELKGALQDVPPDVIANEIAGRWNSFEHALEEAMRTDRDLVLDEEGNLALGAPIRYDAY